MPPFAATSSAPPGTSRSITNTRDFGRDGSPISVARTCTEGTYSIV